MKYEKGFYIPEDTILHNHRRENLKSYIDSEVFSLTLRLRFTPQGSSWYLFLLEAESWSKWRYRFNILDPSTTEM
jgi:hypothetical protein